MLLTIAEIRSELGVAPSAGEAVAVDPRVALCRWSTADRPGEPLMYLIVGPRTVRTKGELVGRLAHTFGEPAVLRMVGGLGDFAVWVSLLGEPAALQVYWGDFLLQIGFASDTPGRLEAAKALSARALARLGGKAAEGEKAR